MITLQTYCCLSYVLYPSLCGFQLQVVPLATGPTLSLKQSTYLITFLAFLTTPVLRTTRFANYNPDLTDEKEVV